MLLAFAMHFAVCLAGSIKDVEHIVVFMQENRAFDHYYGTLDGVRGFNDRAAPLLPSGRPVWYQPVNMPSGNNTICGCGECDIKWGTSPEAIELKNFLLGAQCPTLSENLKGAKPPVHVKAGETCSSLMQLLRASSYDTVAISHAITAVSCPGGAVVHGLEARESNDKFMLPFPLHFKNTSATCMPAPAMGYNSDIGIWNNGSMDAWNTARLPGYGMSYFSREDLPFYYSLADHFTIGDQYFQSTFTATNPNRLHLFSGSNGLSINNSGVNALDDAEPKEGFAWETFGETLESAGVSWKVYQELDNFDDNAFAWFTNFKKSSLNSPLRRKGLERVLNLVNEFERDLRADSLPQFSILIAPTMLSEHATNHPAAGEDLSARILKVLGHPDHKAVYEKTVFILNYDEGGQFFDHHWSPTVPVSPADGKSTVSTVGEVTGDNVKGIPPGQPIGLGFRVPFFIVSPWTRGHYVFSEVADHTSVIQFAEKVFGVKCNNISPWRRAVASDLLSAFDFDNPDYTWPTLPDTRGDAIESEIQCLKNPMPIIPLKQTLPSQEPGTRLSRALPYEFVVHDTVTGGRIDLTLNNTGSAGAVFHVYDYDAKTSPRKYTVEGGKWLMDSWEFSHSYTLSMHGPNGFVRQFRGQSGQAAFDVRTHYNKAGKALVILGEAQTNCSLEVVDNVYNSGGPWKIESPQGQASVPVHGSGLWYDVSVSGKCSAFTQAFSRRLMGRMEVGSTGTSDPAMGRGQVGVTSTVDLPPLHDLPEHLRDLGAWRPAAMCATARSMHKDVCAPLHWPSV